VDVALVAWPSDEERRHRLARDGAPRLLLVEPDTAPPSVHDPLEDWLRVPASEADVHSRVETLRWRAAGHAVVPTVDDDGVVRHNGTRVLVPPVEARLAGALIQRFGAVVSRDALCRAGWPGGAPGRNALDVHVLRLRRRLDRVGLAIRTVRSRGYLLELAPVEPDRPPFARTDRT
jgi:Transcriptional regulatory protein, C terminal